MEEENRTDWMKLGNRIAEMRIARGVTQMELAEKTGLSLTYIGYLEQGKRRGTFHTYLQIVLALGFSLNDLVTTDLDNDLAKCLVWELTRVLSACGADEQESVRQIIQDMVRMIRLFRSE